MKILFLVITFLFAATNVNALHFDHAAGAVASQYSTGATYQLTVDQKIKFGFETLEKSYDNALREFEQHETILYLSPVVDAKRVHGFRAGLDLNIIDQYGDNGFLIGYTYSKNIDILKMIAGLDIRSLYSNNPNVEQHRFELVPYISVFYEF